MNVLKVIGKIALLLTKAFVGLIFMIYAWIGFGYTLAQYKHGYRSDESVREVGEIVAKKTCQNYRNYYKG